MDNVEKNTSKDVHIELLKDALCDLRTHNRFKNKIIAFLSGVIVFCLIGYASLGIYYQERFVRFVSDYDVSIENSFYSDDSSSTDNNSVSVSR